MDEAAFSKMCEQEGAHPGKGGEGPGPQPGNQQAEDRERNAKMQIQAVVQQCMTQEARARLAMIEMTKPELAERVIQQVLFLTQGGRRFQKFSDEEMKSLLESLSEFTQKKGTKITYNRRRAALDSDDDDW